MENRQFQLFKDSYSGDVEAKGTKVCNKCSNTLPLSHFGPANGGVYLRPECRSCLNHGVKIRKGLRDVHGMAPANHTCPLCLCSEEEAQGKGGFKSSAWVLDHNHETETFRGWLCHSCNRALGVFNDDVPRLKRAIKYIEGKLNEHKE